MLGRSDGIPVVVGVPEGEAVGTLVGNTVTVGAADGATVGRDVGETDGPDKGSGEEEAVRLAVVRSHTVGEAEGCSECMSEGWPETVGLAVGRGANII